MFLHMLGSVVYVFGVIGAVVLNEAEDMHAGIVTICFFGTFCFCSYLTGEYFPVVRFMRFYIMVWNPFAVDQNFLDIMYNALQRDAHVHRLTHFGREGGTHLAAAPRERVEVHQEESATV